MTIAHMLRNHVTSARAARIKSAGRPSRPRWTTAHCKAFVSSPGSSRAARRARSITQIDDNGAGQKLAVLIHDMPKVTRTGCRLPIDHATAQLIITQKHRVRERYPDTPTCDCGCFRAPSATRTGPRR